MCPSGLHPWIDKRKVISFVFDDIERDFDAKCKSLNLLYKSSSRYSPSYYFVQPIEFDSSGFEKSALNKQYLWSLPMTPEAAVFLLARVKCSICLAWLPTVRFPKRSFSHMLLAMTMSMSFVTIRQSSPCFLLRVPCSLLRRLLFYPSSLN